MQSNPRETWFDDWLGTYVGRPADDHLLPVHVIKHPKPPVSWREWANIRHQPICYSEAVSATRRRRQQPCAHPGSVLPRRPRRGCHRLRTALKILSISQAIHLLDPIVPKTQGDQSVPRTTTALCVERFVTIVERVFCGTRPQSRNSVPSYTGAYSDKPVQDYLGHARWLHTSSHSGRSQH